VLVPIGMGYWFGRNEQLVLQHLRRATLFLAAGYGVIMFLPAKSAEPFAVNDLTPVTDGP